MTLFEALVALVILGLAAVGALEAIHTSSRTTRDAAVWVQAVGYAESTMEQTKLGNGVAEIAADPTLPGGFSRRVTVQPWVRGIDRVSVSIGLPGGGAFVLDRLVRTQ
jgi:Tfp pilus assembly protein PilV